jgi:hypothetical protein
VRSLALLAEDLRDTGEQCELWPDLEAMIRPREVALQKAREKTGSAQSLRGGAAPKAIP